MVDEIKSNLEPIEEGDINLKEKFVGAEKIENPEGKIDKIHPIEREVMTKESVSEKETAYSKILSKIDLQKQTVISDEDVRNDAKIANEEIDTENKINNLVKVAENKGIAYAVKVARHLEDNYTLDEFHDRLLGEELHKALIEKGIIKEI